MKRCVPLFERILSLSLLLSLPFSSLLSPLFLLTKSFVDFPITFLGFIGFLDDTPITVIKQETRSVPTLRNVSLLTNQECISATLDFT